MQSSHEILSGTVVKTMFFFKFMDPNLEANRNWWGMHLPDRIESNRFERIFVIEKHDWTSETNQLHHHQFLRRHNIKHVIFQINIPNLKRVEIPDLRK